MFKPLDVEGRLRFFRYGIVVIVVVTFVVGSFVPMMFLASSGYGTGQLFVMGLVTALIVGVAMGLVYFGYRYLLMRNAGK
ncbi:MAG: hypothetical protein IPK52_16955 [Chloroflexi bacterium]|nr:hypothetical protein [Chloroflexota bacterium]